MQQIAVEAFKGVIAVEQGNTSVDFIDVCTPAEYREKHIHGVRSVPLDSLEARVDELRDKKRIYVYCRSGRRAERAIALLTSKGISADMVNVTGGLAAWEAAGFGTVTTDAKLPIMRQTFIAAAVLILIAHGLYLVAGPAALLLSLVVALGLLFSGITGWCGMALFLARMPWNR